MDQKGKANLSPTIFIQPFPPVITSIAEHKMLNVKDEINSEAKGDLGPLTSEENNNTVTVATQTKPCGKTSLSTGQAGLNLFFCTFHVDGSVETYCDLPIGHGKSKSSQSRRQYADKVKKDRNEKNRMCIEEEKEEEENEDMQQCGMGKRQILSPRGRVIKVKSSLFKVDLGHGDEDSKSDSEYEVQEEDVEEEEGEYVGKAVTQRNSFCSKRGTKRKKRPSDGYDEDPQPKKEIETKKEPLGNDEGEDISEVDTEILKKKPMTKNLPKKYNLKEKIEKKQTKDPEPLQCHECKQYFPSFFQLEKHGALEHNGMKYSFPCDSCSMDFTRPYNLERHKKSFHSEEKPYPCEHCGRRFTRKDRIVAHIKVVHSTNEEMKGSEENKEKLFPCEACNRHFATKDRLEKHVSSIHSHQDKGNKPKPPKKGDYQCSSCGLNFIRKQNLKQHRLGDFKCSECGAGHECRKALLKHVYSCHPSTCTVCGKVCSSRLVMIAHRYKHSQKWVEYSRKNKKFTCDQCGKRFLYRAYLDNHMRSHTGEKPFTCEVCNSTFSQKGNLIAHVKSIHGVVMNFNHDGTTKSELVKYKRPKRTSKPPPLHPIDKVEHPAIPHSSFVPTQFHPETKIEVIEHSLSYEVEESPPSPNLPPHIEIQEGALDTEADVYQIVYAYPE